MKLAAKSKNNHTLPAALIGCLATSIILASVVTSFIISGMLAETTIRFTGLISLFLSSLIGALLAGRGGESKVILRIALFALLYFLIALFIGAVILNSTPRYLVETVITILAASLLSCALCIRKGNSKRRRKKRVC